MRRKEFEILNQTILEDFLNTQRVGTLCWDSGKEVPQAFPVNFLLDQGKIYFHGSSRGEKSSIQPGQGVTFSVYEILAYLSTDLWPKGQACDVTQFFRSVLITGSILPLKDPEEKMRILNRLVQSHQETIPFIPLSDSKAPVLTHTEIWEITPQSMTGKFKLGQNLSPQGFGDLLKGLRNRGLPLDIYTADLMEVYGGQ